MLQSFNIVDYILTDELSDVTWIYELTTVKAHIFIELSYFIEKHKVIDLTEIGVDRSPSFGESSVLNPEPPALLLTAVFTK